MADVYLDCEWVTGKYLTILGAYSYGQSRFQLYDKTLTRNRFSRFLNLCSCDCPGSILIFCHGPDIGRVEEYFGLDLKIYYPCVNVVTAFKRFTNFKSAPLGHLERHFGLSRRYAFESHEIDQYWRYCGKEGKKIVLEYNWEDCLNLWRLVKTLRSEYHVTNGELCEIAMKFHQ